MVPVLLERPTLPLIVQMAIDNGLKEYPNQAARRPPATTATASSSSSLEDRAVVVAWSVLEPEGRVVRCVGRRRLWIWVRRRCERGSLNERTVFST